jgi:hypothetical protein
MDNPWPDNREMMALIPTTVGSDVTGQGAQYPAAPNRMTGR